MSDYSDFDFLPTTPAKKKSNTLPYVIISILFLALIGGGAYVIVTKRGGGETDAKVRAAKAREDAASQLMASVSRQFNSGEFDKARDGISQIMASYADTGAMKDAIEIKAKIDQMIADAREIDGLASTIKGMTKLGNYDGASQALEIFATTPAKAAIAGAAERIEKLRAMIKTERTLNDLTGQIGSALTSRDFAAAQAFLEDASAIATGSLSETQIAALKTRYDAEKQAYDSAADALFKECVEQKTIGDFSGASASLSALLRDYPQAAIIQKVNAFNKTLREDIQNRRGIIDQMITSAEKRMRDGDLVSASAILDSLPVSIEDMALKSAQMELIVRSAALAAAKINIESGVDAVTNVWAPAMAAAAEFVQSFPNSDIATSLYASISEQAAKDIERAKVYVETVLNNVLQPKIKAAIESDDFNAAYEVYKEVSDKPDAVKESIIRQFSNYRRRIVRDGLLADEKLVYKTAKVAPPGIVISSQQGTVFKKPISGDRVPKGAFEETAAYIEYIDNKSKHIIIDMELMVSFELYKLTYESAVAGQEPRIKSSETKRLLASDTLYYPTLNKNNPSPIRFPGESIALVAASAEICPGHFDKTPREYQVGKPPLAEQIASVSYIETDVEAAPAHIINLIRARAQNPKEAIKPNSPPTELLWRLLPEFWNRNIGLETRETARNWMKTDAFFSKAVPDDMRSILE
ncbi:MAG: hypothetical protein ABIH86_03730 [Planctomycetota bacterium]